MADGPDALIAGQYRLAEELGRGGFGVVWRARDERLHRDVAVKELFLPTYLGRDQWYERHQRSLREARSAARIVHPAAVTVYDVVEHDGCPWIIMELIDGRALNAIVRAHGPLAPRRAARMGLEVLGALQAAHAAGVVHRDVKPGNVLIGERRIVLTDFGIATIEGDPALTHSGFVMGAPAYTAPERARGEPAVPSSDLWSLGATLFYAVEGHRPYPGPNANAVFHAILNGEPAFPVHAGPLTPVITGLMRKNIEERLTAAAATVMLQEIIDSPSNSVFSTSYGPSRTRVEPAHPSRRPRGGRRAFTVMATAAALATGATVLIWPGHADSKRPARHLNAAATRTRPPIALPKAPDKQNAVAFSPDGTLLAAAGEDSRVRLFHVAERRQIAVLKGHGYAVFALAFSPDGRTLATGGYDSTVILWDVPHRRRTATFNPHQGVISSVDFSLDGTLLAAAGSEGVTVWNTHTNASVKSFNHGEGQYVTDFGEGGTLAIASPQTVRLWHPGSRTTTVLGRTTSLTRTMAISPGGHLVACGGDDGRVTLWNVRTRKPVTHFDHDRSVHSVTFSPDAQTLATASGPTVTLWNTTTNKRLRTLTGHTDLIGGIAYSPHPHPHLLATAAYDHTIRLWQLP